VHIMITLQLHSNYALQKQPTQKELNVMHWANSRYFCFHLLQRASSVTSECRNCTIREIYLSHIPSNRSHLSLHQISAVTNISKNSQLSLQWAHRFRYSTHSQHLNMCVWEAQGTITSKTCWHIMQAVNGLKSENIKTSFRKTHYLGNGSLKMKVCRSLVHVATDHICQ